VIDEDIILLDSTRQVEWHAHQQHATDTGGDMSD